MINTPTSQDSDTTVPRHIGFILDGNRRWAENNQLPTLEGHRRGYERILAITEAAIERNIPFVSGYIFSTENWKRSPEEISYLFDLVLKMVTRDLKRLNKMGARLVWLGSRRDVPADLAEAILHAEQETKHNQVITLGICFNYGGHREIVEATQRMISDGLKAEDLDETKFTQYLYDPSIPPIDLIVRTSGEQRLSNFMLWRAAYSEFIFRDEHWPDFSVEALDQCLLEYSHRQRRHGA